MAAQVAGAPRGSLSSLALADAGEWWSEIGRAGSGPERALGTGFPWTLAGLARGGWLVADPGERSSASPYPGLPSALAPLASFDSLAFRIGEDEAWDGYEAVLARLAAERGPRRGPRTRSVFNLLNGGFGLDETGLRIERGDSRRAFSAAASSGTRGERGALGLAGRHRWDASGSWRRGAQALEACYAQRGAAGRLRGGEEERAGGESGQLDYRYRAGGLSAALSLARGHDARQSFLPARDTLVWSRRDADGERVAAEAALARAFGVAGVRFYWSRGHVRRDRVAGFDRRASATWSAARFERPAGEGTLDLELGAGHHQDFGGWDLAPGVAYRFAVAPFAGRVAVERMLVPVWSDLARGVAPFMQRTWLAGLEVAAGAGRERHARVGFWMGSSRDRAIVSRLPLEEQWLRAGVARDPARYDFGLLLAGAGWRRGHAAVEAEGFALARDHGPLQPAVDPSRGARGGVEWSFRAFQDDLGVTLRAEAEGMGPRESETTPVRRLRATAGVGAAAVLTLGDAVVTVRGLNLGKRVREETWVDSATGNLARGAGREFRLSVLWPLFN